MYRLGPMVGVLVALIMIAQSAGCLAIAELDKSETSTSTSTRGLGAACHIDLDCDEGYRCDERVMNNGVFEGVCRLGEGQDCTNRDDDCASAFHCSAGGERPGQMLCQYSECHL